MKLPIWDVFDSCGYLFVSFKKGNSEYIKNLGPQVD